jgi:hypothetical protein
LFEIWSLEEDTPKFDESVLIEEKKQDFLN